MRRSFTLLFPHLIVLISRYLHSITRGIMENSPCVKSFFLDMHVHTGRYSECAESLDPHQIEKYARNAGLHGVVITEHDMLWNKEQLEELQQSISSITLFSGVEVTTKTGHHLVLIGVAESSGLYTGIPCSDAISLSHEQGGVAILAHPYRNGLPPLHLIDRVDAIETGSYSLTARESELSSHLAAKLGKPSIGCSDAHALCLE